jgi:two-component system, sensor histidine kinase
MGGKIWLISHPGKGSAFHVELPLQQVEEEIPEQSPDRIHHTATSRESIDEKLILLADDAEENCDVLEAFLMDTRYRLTIVDNGRQAVELFKEGSFQLILMDVNMPVMDGYEATKQIRSWEHAQSRTPVPILALTANAMKSDIEKTRLAGCNLHLSKPIRKKRLLEVLNMFFQN